MLPRFPTLSLVALSALSCSDKGDTNSPAPCAGEQAVVDALTRKAEERAATLRLPALRTAHALLYDLADARAKLRACQATTPPNSGAGDPPAAIAEDVGAAPSLDDGREELAKIGKQPPSNVELAAIDPDRLLSPSRPVSVKFLDGVIEGQRWVAETARLWTQCPDTSLQFEFFDDKGNSLDGALAPPPSYDIRVTFEGSSYWSLVGRNPGADPNAATMQLAGLDKTHLDQNFRQRTVVHEFGHALSLHHEHRRKEMIACIDQEEAIKYYGGAPNRWDSATTIQQLLTPLSDDIDTSLKYDPDSVMNYVLPERLMKPDCPIPLPRPSLRPSKIDCEAIAFHYRAQPPLEGTRNPKIPFTTKTEPTRIRVDRQYYRWTVKPKGPTKDIASVSYDMRPYFEQVTRDAKQNFEVTRESWGTFPIELEVRYKNGKPPDRYTYSPELGEGVPPK